MATCPVCCEKYTIIQRRCVRCAGCGYEACASCIKNYLVRSVNDADCMSCHQAFDREFLVTSLTRAFVDGMYKAHRENVLVEREVALLPEAQTAVENYKLAMDLEQKADEKWRLICEMKRTLIDLTRQRDQDIYRRHRIMHSHYQSDGLLAGGSQQRGDQERSARIVCGCPVQECRGFVTTKYTCGTCQIKLCRDCLEILPEDPQQQPHTCNPEVKATAELIKKDTKPCPKCAVMIHKIDGCSQMWCTQCHVAFSWVTGQIETGRVHNPHYYAWMRAQSATGEIPREPGDEGGRRGPCDRHELPSIYGLYRSLQADHNLSRGAPICDEIARFHRSVQHVQCVELPNYRVRPVTINTNLDLRMNYLLHKINKATWKRQLAIREKARSKKIEHTQIFELYCDVVIDNMWAIIQKTKEFDLCIREMRAIGKHANRALHAASKQYTCVKKTVYEGSLAT